MQAARPFSERSFSLPIRPLHFLSPFRTRDRFSVQPRVTVTPFYRFTASARWNFDMCVVSPPPRGLFAARDVGPSIAGVFLVVKALDMRTETSSSHSRWTLARPGIGIANFYACGYLFPKAWTFAVARGRLHSNLPQWHGYRSSSTPETSIAWSPWISFEDISQRLNRGIDLL